MWWPLEPLLCLHKGADVQAFCDIGLPQRDYGSSDFDM